MTTPRVESGDGRQRWWIPVVGVILVVLVFGAVELSRSRFEHLVQTARIFVHGPDGAPVSGIRVYAGSSRHLHCLGTTNGAGCASARSLADTWSLFEALEVFLRVPGLESERRALASEVHFTVPELVALDLQLCDADGSPRGVLHPEDAFVQLGWTDEWGSEYQRPDLAGRWSFPRVVAGVELQLQWGLQGWRTAKDFHTPTSAEPPQPIGLCLQEDLFRIEGRMIGASGEPLSERFGFSLDGEGLHMSAWSVSTDGDGRLEFVGERLPASGRMTFHRQNGEKLDVPLRAGRNERERTIGELQWSRH